MTPKRIRITQIDGALPNLALMKLTHYHRSRGDDVTFTRQAHRDLLEGDYDIIYGSSIFQFSADKTARFLESWPKAIIGGTGTNNKITVEDLIGPGDYEHYDYSAYPTFEPSIGFTQRGCRLSCKFCVVPEKEGKPRSVSTLADIWRGGKHPKKLHLLDNDFFGQPEDQWMARIEEARLGNFKICLNQGINVRHLTPIAAQALASVEYRDADFQRRKIYTAWDNLKDEGIFFKGVDMLEAAGIPPRHIRCYMLVAFDKNETWERVHHRFDAMVKRGIEPFPMVFDCRKTDPDRYRKLKQFQRWAVTGLYRAVPFKDYQPGLKRRPPI
jgi:hypothetical protein